MHRITEVDALRGIAIILMIIYHFFFDLAYFGIHDINIFDTAMVLLQRTVGTLFLFLVGFSLVLSEKRNREGYIHHAKRAARLGMVAALITIVTWIYPHEGFIKFGIIHMIALSTLIAPFFLRFGPANLILALIIITVGWGIHYTDSPYLFWLGWIRPDYFALDHYSLFPWFGIILIGIYAAQNIRIPKIGYNLDLLALLGRNSLLIYMVHQPLLVALMLMLVIK